MKVFLPYRSEFGFICMFHVPWVNSFPKPKTVIIEEGMEALYPDCEYVYLEGRRNDADRRPKPEKELEKEWQERIQSSGEYLGDVECLKMPYPADRADPRSYFVPQPFVVASPPQEYDVCVCPRKRAYGEAKNWEHWQALVDVLRWHGRRVFAAGHPESSYEVNGCETAWTVGSRCLDESIQAMLHSRVVVATDAGLAHLALMCGRPLVLITHKVGMVAPGQDDLGKDYWPVHIDRFHEENHQSVPIIQVNYGWRNIEPVLATVEAFLEEEIVGDLPP